MKKDKIPAVIVFVISIGFLIYFIKGLVPELSLRFDYGTATANIIRWEQEDAEIYVVYSYQHSDGHQYTVYKEIKRPNIADLKNKKEITIKYSNQFPAYTLVEGVPDRSYILIIPGIIIMLIGVYGSIRVFLGRLKPEDFYLTGKKESPA